MAPFVIASEVQLASESLPDDVQVYRGNADSFWTVGAVPHGGYLLSLIVGACVKYQASSHNPDPIHVTAHYLRATSVGPLEIHVRSTRTGKTLSNLSAELVQGGVVKITTHLIFGVLDASSLPPPEIPLTLHPPAPHARLTPFLTHPSASPSKALLSRHTFRSYVTCALDPAIPQSAGGGIDVGEWYSWNDPEDTQLTAHALAFFADLFPNLLPPLVAGTLPPSWFPTVALTLEFKTPIPHGARVLGSYATCKFVNDPQGRHDVYSELWTAPEGEDDGGDWRTAQRCLLVSHQTALVLPMSVNEKKRKANL